MRIRPRRRRERSLGSPASWAELVEACAERLVAKGITIPAGELDLDRFLREVEAACGYRIHLEAMRHVHADTRACGLKFNVPSGVRIIYGDSTSGWQRLATIVHECAHELFDHGAVGPREVEPRILEMVSFKNTLLGVSPQYSEQAEREANAAAAVLVGRWKEPPPHRWSSMTTLRDGAARTAAVFGWTINDE